MAEEITLEDLNLMLATPAAQPKAKAKGETPAYSTHQEISFDELNETVLNNQPAKEPSFFKGVVENIKGGFKKQVKGFQIQAAEYNAKDEEALKAYGQALGEAERNSNAPQVAKLKGLISETQKRIDQRNAQPEVQAKVKALTSAIQSINEDMIGATPKDMGFWKGSAFNAAVSVGTMAPALAAGVATGGASVPLTAIGLQTFASSYADNRTKGLEPQKAGRLAAIDGMTESLTELLPTSRLIKAKGVLRKFLESTIADIPGEELANYIQNATQAVADLGKDPSDEQVRNALKASVETSTGEIGSVAASTAMAGGALAGTVSAAQGAANLRGKKKEEVAPVEAPVETPPEKPKKPHLTPTAKEAYGEPVKQENLPEGSEGLDLNELLSMPAPDAKADILSFKDTPQNAVRRQLQERLADPEFSKWHKWAQEWVQDQGGLKAMSRKEIQDLRTNLLGLEESGKLSKEDGKLIDASLLQELKTKPSEVTMFTAGEFQDGDNPAVLSPTDKVSPYETRLVKNLRELHADTKPALEMIANRAGAVARNAKAKGLNPFSSTVVSAHQLLNRMSTVATGPYKSLIEKLQEYVPQDTQIHFQWVEPGEGLTLPNGKKEDERTAGLYFHKGDTSLAGHVLLKINGEMANKAELMRNIMHELFHTASHDYITSNWNSATVKQLKDVYLDTIDAMKELRDEFRASGMSEGQIEDAMGGWFEATLGAKGNLKVKGESGLYGLTNVSEMIAEAYSNPLFMAAVAKASPRAKGLWNKIKTYFNKIVGEIAEALGFNKHDAGLLHDIYNAAEDVMFAQKSSGAKGTSRAKVEGPKTKPSVRNAMKLLTASADKVPGVSALRSKVDQYLREVKQNIAPETLGPKAEHSAAILSKWIVTQMKSDASFDFQAKTRRDFWVKNEKVAREFIAAYESGWTPKDPKFKEIAQAYRDWSDRLAKEDASRGIEYEARDNYLFHIFKDREKVAEYMQRKFGKKWGDPRFIKDRSYDLYEEAIKAGFKPLYTNPEDIMLARQHASDIAHMKIGALNELTEAGLAWREKPANIETVAWRSPAGEWYYVHHQAAAILHNAWNTQSLWSREGMVGDAFRGAMYLKNRLVPIKLSLSLFHFFHVLTINNATGMLRATKGLMLGNVSAGKWLKEMGKAAAYTDLISGPRFGGRIRAVFRGEIPPSQILPHEALAIQYMIEGGMLPEQSHQYKSNAKIAFAEAIKRARKEPWAVGRAAYEAPFAALDWMQHWMFEKWIPSIKTASYLKEVQTALESDPTLVQDQQRRQIIFHKLAKSVDNRHGEMVYKTMFWNKWIKDTAVVNLLSLGWQMGFIREYGGALGDLKNLATREGDLPTKIKAAQLDRPLFVAFYTAQSLMYGGLLTWALSGEPPEEWKDYIYPKSGGKNPDGTDARVNTMFYAREFASIAEHIKEDGIGGGLAKTAANKASGIFGLAWQSYSGVDDFGKEYRDPDGSATEKVTQTLDFVLSELTPISAQNVKEEGLDPKSVALNVAGFSKAPGYATRGPAEAAIRHTWQKYNAKTQTSYERAAYSKDMKELRKARDEGDTEAFGVKFDEMVGKYKLNAADRKRIRTSLRKTGTSEESMFKSLTWQQQEKLLNEMSEEDREKYLPISNKSHLRRKFVPEEVE